MILTSALLCMATNIYHEARGEPVEGQLAVAQVTMTRAKQNKELVCKVVLEKNQFSWTRGGVTKIGKVPVLKSGFLPKDSASWGRAMAIAGWTLTGIAPNPVGSSSFYHADYVRPTWAKKMQLVAKVGSHLFYKLA